MDSQISNGAAHLLDFIASYEAPRGYDTIFGNHQNSLPRLVTALSLDELAHAQLAWSKQFGSSAAGRYQFMRATLLDLRNELNIPGSERFTPDLQDRLAFRLLLRRSYAKFIAGSLSLEGFALQLAMEWASLPVLRQTQGAHRTVARGQSYYAGDGLNKALVAPEKVDALLKEVHAAEVRTVAPVVKDGDLTDPAGGANRRSTPAMNTDGTTKPWYMSKAVIGGLISIAVPILSIFFPEARLVDPSTATDWILKIVEIAGPVLGGVLAIFGRTTAVKPIAGTKVAEQQETFLNGAGQISSVLNTGFLQLPQLLGQLVEAIGAGGQKPQNN